MWSGEGCQKLYENTNPNMVDYKGLVGARCHLRGYHNYPWGWAQTQVTYSLDTTSTLSITTLVKYYN